MAYFTRKPTRIPGYDYATYNYYFLTVCTYEKRCIFGKQRKLNEHGIIAEECILSIHDVFSDIIVDKYVVMPNHIHMILITTGKTNICTAIGQYKSVVTKKIHNVDPEINVWQRSFHDHIIRNQKEYENIWEYIQYNDQKWAEDCFYPKEQNVREGH